MSNLKSLKLNNNYYIYLVLFFSIFYAYFISNIIPFDHQIVADRQNYITKVIKSEFLLSKYLKSGFFTLLSNEPIYLYINYILFKIFHVELVIKIIIFFSSFLTSYLVLKHNPRYFFFLILFLFFPALIFKFISHIRQGVAISIFLLGWFSAHKNLRLLLYFFSALIHSSFLIVSFLYFLAWIFEKLKFSIILRIIFTIFFGLFFSFSIKYISEILGARQSQTFLFEIGDVSGFGFIVWLFIFFLYFMEGYKFIKNNNFAFICIIFYLSTYFFLDFTIRIFEAIIIIILLASLDLTFWRKQIFKVTFIFLFFASWILRLTEYGLID